MPYDSINSDRLTPLLKDIKLDAAEIAAIRSGFYRLPRDEELTLKFHITHNDGFPAPSYTIDIQIQRADGATISLFRFMLAAYPACCAIGQIYHFTYASCLTERVVHAFMKICQENVFAYFLGMYWKNKRLLVMMVESRSKFNIETDKLIQIDKPKIMYPFLYSYFKKHRVKTSLMHNLNTNNIIHSMEVTFK